MNLWQLLLKLLASLLMAVLPRSEPRLLLKWMPLPGSLLPSCTELPMIVLFSLPSRRSYMLLWLLLLKLLASSLMVVLPRSEPRPLLKWMLLLGLYGRLLSSLSLVPLRALSLLKPMPLGLYTMQLLLLLMRSRLPLVMPSTVSHPRSSALSLWWSSAVSLLKGDGVCVEEGLLLSVVSSLVVLAYVALLKTLLVLMPPGSYAM